MALFVPLDTNWPDDESIIEVGLDGAGLHAFILCLAKRSESDGWVGRRTLIRYGATDELLDRLATCDPSPLIERREDGSVRSVGWHKRNPSQAAIEARKTSRALAGIKGNHERWHSGDFDTCGPCQTKKAEVIAGSETGAIPTVVPSDRTSSPESESETEGASDRTGSHGFAGPKPTAALAVVRGSLGSPSAQEAQA